MRGRGQRAGQPLGRRGFPKSLARLAGEPADHALGRSRGGFGSKFHLVTDGQGTPLAVEVSAGEVHESVHAESVIGAATATRIARRRGRLGHRDRPRQMAGDKGFSAGSLRAWLWERRIEPVIPRKLNEHARGERFDHVAYRGRAVVEQCVGWLKERRRIGTRYEKLAVSFLAMLHLGMIQRYLRMLF